jgi:hypothetical protein
MSHRRRAVVQQHGDRIAHLLCDTLYKDKQHPIFNFMMQYFHVSMKRLFIYSPGIGVDVSDELDYIHRHPELSKYLRLDGRQARLVPPPLTPEKVVALRNTLTLLKNTASKAPMLSCYGLHEWAMLYRDDGNSGGGVHAHQSLPLRVSHATIREAVVGRLRCSHFDAVRHFAPAARPLNTALTTPTRANQHLTDQPGCVHVSMDLFKWAVKLFPFIESGVIADALAVALQAREVDMRASPYDLTAYRNGQLGGTFRSDPICVETPEGRRQYAVEQRMLFDQAAPVRAQLVAAYEAVLAAAAAQEAGFCGGADHVQQTYMT